MHKFLGYLVVYADPEGSLGLATYLHVTDWPGHHAVCNNLDEATAFSEDQAREWALLHPRLGGSKHLAALVMPAWEETRRLVKESTGAGLDHTFLQRGLPLPASVN